MQSEHLWAGVLMTFYGSTPDNLEHAQSLLTTLSLPGVEAVEYDLATGEVLFRLDHGWTEMLLNKGSLELEGKDKDGIPWRVLIERE